MLAALAPLSPESKVSRMIAAAAAASADACTTGDDDDGADADGAKDASTSTFDTAVDCAGISASAVAEAFGRAGQPCTLKQPAASGAAAPTAYFAIFGAERTCPVGKEHADAGKGYYAIRASGVTGKCIASCAGHVQLTPARAARIIAACGFKPPASEEACTLFEAHRAATLSCISKGWAHADVAALYRVVAALVPFVKAPTRWYAYDDASRTWEATEGESAPARMVNHISGILCKLADAADFDAPVGKSGDRARAAALTARKASATSAFVRGVMDFLTGPLMDAAADDRFDAKRGLFAFSDGWAFDMDANARAGALRQLVRDDFVSTTCGYARPAPDESSPRSAPSWARACPTPPRSTTCSGCARTSCTAPSGGRFLSSGAARRVLARACWRCC